MSDAALRIKGAVLALKRFTEATLCDHTGASRQDVESIVQQLLVDEVLIRQQETSNLGYVLTSDPARVRRLADEIYRHNRSDREPSLQLDSVRSLSRELESLKLAVDVCEVAVEVRPILRSHLQRLEQRLEVAHGQLRTESLKAGLDWANLEERGHPLVEAWNTWQDCARRAGSIIDDWSRVPHQAAEQPRRPPSGEFRVPVSAVRGLRTKFGDLDTFAADLSRGEEPAWELCREVRREFSHGLCAVQRIRPDDVIETVVGDGDAKSWVGLSKHRVALAENLRDIQADVALRQRAEVIRAWDPRLDHYLFEKFGHRDLVRIFMPMVVFRDASGTIQEQVPDTCRWRVSEQPTAPHGELVLHLEHPAHLRPDVFGTFETGFRVAATETNGSPTIAKEEALAVAEFVTRAAVGLFRHSLEYALEKTVEWIREVANGDSAILELEISTPFAQTSYAVSSRGGAGRLVRLHRDADVPQHASRLSLLGRRARESAHYQVFHQAEWGQHSSPTDAARSWTLSATTIAAFPLNMGIHSAVVYVLYETETVPDDNALKSAWVLAKRCSQILGSALDKNRVRDVEQQMAALNSVLNSFYEPLGYSSGTLARSIVWNTHNLLAADVVTLSEYDEQTATFSTKRHLAGRLMNEAAAEGPALPDDLRWRVLRLPEQALFVSTVDAEPLMRARKVDGSRSFIEREKIVSFAAVVLTAGEEQVGVLFINFRLRRAFSDHEREFVRHLAEASGVALKRGRREKVAVASEIPASERLAKPSTSGTASLGVATVPLVLSYDEVIQLHEPQRLVTFGK